MSHKLNYLNVLQLVFVSSLTQKNVD